MSLNFKENQISWDNKFIQAYCLNGEKDKYFYFSHANGFNGLTYQSLLQKISSEFKVITYDMRGHGRTTLTADPKKLNSWHRFRDDLIYLVENLNSPAVLSGHSLGGTVSLLVALKKPTLVKKLILIDPVILPLKYILAYKILNLLNFQHFVSPLAKNALIRQNGWKNKEEAFEYFSNKKLFSKVSRKILNDYVEQSLVKNENNKLNLRCNPEWESACFRLSSYEVWFGLKYINIPIKIVLTNNSRVCNKTAQRRIKKILPQTEIVFVKNTTHMLPLEAAEEVSNEINNFL